MMNERKANWYLLALLWLIFIAVVLVKSGTGQGIIVVAGFAAVIAAACLEFAVLNYIYVWIAGAGLPFVDVPKRRIVIMILMALVFGVASVLILPANVRRVVFMYSIAIGLVQLLLLLVGLARLFLVRK